MISPEQLSAALQRLDPRDWEVLDLSLRRRVPDEALARLFDTAPPEVARRRAFAIEHLADELGVQRGEDLGAVLKALLEPETWEEAEREQGEGWHGFSDPTAPVEERPPVEAAPADDDASEPADAATEAFTESRTSETARHFRIAPVPELPPIDLERDQAPTAIGQAPPEPAPAEELPPSEAPPAAETPPSADEAPPADADGASASAAAAEAEAEAEPAEADAAPAEADAAPAEADAAPEEAEPEGAEAEPAERLGAASPDAPAVAPTNGGVPPAPEPVLDMLVERDHEERRRRIRTPLLWALAGGLGAAGLFAAGYAGANWFDDDDVQRASGSGGDAAPRRFVPSTVGPLAEPFPSDPRDATCYPTAAVSRDVVLYARPGSKRRLRVPARTEWDSPRIMSVVRRRGDWLAVLAPELKNGEVGWMRSAGARLDCVRWSLHVDLSRRKLYVRKNGRTTRKMTVAIGSKRHPTPKGRFAVTDKLKVVDKGSPYGCCVLALSGHQTRLPPDWPGGDRLAVHATSDLSSIGKPVSLGCMRSHPKQVEWLIKTVPLGAPIFIRA